MQENNEDTLKSSGLAEIPLDSGARPNPHDKVEFLDGAGRLPEELQDFVGPAKKFITEGLKRFGITNPKFTDSEDIVSKSLPSEYMGYSSRFGIAIDYEKMLKKCGGDQDLALYYSADELTEELFHSTGTYSIGSILEEGLAHQVTLEAHNWLARKFPKGYKKYSELCNREGVSPYERFNVYPSNNQVNQSYLKSDMTVLRLALNVFNNRVDIFYRARVNKETRTSLFKELAISLGEDTIIALLKKSAIDYELED